MKALSILKNIIAFLVIIPSFAQQIPNYTQYMYNMQILNPAYVGVPSDLSIALLGRSQWLGIEGAPKTETFSINARVLDGIGIGFSAVHDKIGLAEETNINIDVSYTLVLNNYDRMSFGIKGGASFYNNNLANGITPDNEVYASTNGTYPNIGIGAFYYNQHFYVGLAAPYILKTPTFKLDTENYVSELSEKINFFVTSGYVFELSDNYKFKPSLLVSYVKSLPISVDINTNMLYKDKFELGVSYRYNNAFSAMFVANLSKSFRIGYSYNYLLTSLGEYSSGSHELMVLFNFDFKKRGRWLESSSCYF